MVLNKVVMRRVESDMLIRGNVVVVMPGISSSHKSATLHLSINVASVRNINASGTRYNNSRAQTSLQLINPHTSSFDCNNGLKSS